MARLSRFTTEGVCAGARVPRWDDALWSSLVPFRTRADGHFAGEADFGAAGAIHLFRIAATRHQLERSEADALPGGLLQLIVQRRGTSTITQCGRRLELAPGGWTICDADRAFMLHAEAGELLMALVPRERLGFGSALPPCALHSFGSDGGTARLLPRYLADLMEEIGGVADSNCGELADMAAQLVRLALLEARNAVPPVSMRETLRLRVKDHVRRNLRDPALSIDRVAAAFGCTKRHLHKVFSGDEVTLSQFIWQQRLECCRDALGNPALGRHSITEIAFMWGFNNSAHFSKAFKERFGLPPGLFRERSAKPTRPLFSRKPGEYQLLTAA